MYQAERGVTGVRVRANRVRVKQMNESDNKQRNMSILFCSVYILYYSTFFITTKKNALLALPSFSSQVHRTILLALSVPKW